MAMKTMAQALAEADEEQTLFLSPEQATKRWIGSGEDVPYTCPFTVEELEWEERFLRASNNQGNASVQA